MPGKHIIRLVIFFVLTIDEISAIFFPNLEPGGRPKLAWERAEVVHIFLCYYFWAAVKPLALYLLAWISDKSLFTNIQFIYYP